MPKGTYKSKSKKRTAKPLKYKKAGSKKAKSSKGLTGRRGAKK